MKEYSADLAFRKWLLIAFSAALMVIALCITFAKGQTVQWKQLLGERHPSFKFTPKHRIPYDAGGYDEPKRKLIKRAGNYLTDMGAAHLVDGFKSFATSMTEDMSAIPAWIDLAFDEIQSKWIACGGRFEQAARAFNPRNLFVIIEDRPFWVVEHGLFANGMTDGRLIRVVNVSTSYLHSNPSQASLVLLPDLLRWEIGNTFQLAAFGYPGSISEEIGSGSPCGN